MAPNVFSLGRLTSMLQANHDTILVAARRLGIEPTLLLNNVPYFAAAEVDRIREEIVATKHCAHPELSTVINRVKGPTA